MASPLHSLLLISSLAAALATTAGKPSLPWVPSNMTVLIAPVLANLEYFRLADVVQATVPFLSGPVTIFAPSDDFVGPFIVTPTCSPFRLLREHVVPGLVSADHLSRLPFGSKLNTDAPGRCLTVTRSRAKIFVDGVEITRPDLYNHSRILIHGIQGLVAPLSPLSCVEIPDPALRWPEIAADPSAVLRDAAARLHHAGYSFLALAMRDKHEMAALKKMTVFALDDSSISAGGYAYVTNVRFHVVPGGVLSHADLLRLPKGTILPTLVPGQRLEVTHGGAAAGDSLMLPGAEFRINYVPFRAPDLVYNARIAVHGIYMPFPHL